jgi:hypothetical protein
MSTTDETLAALDIASELKDCQAEINIYQSVALGNRKLEDRLRAGGFGRDFLKVEADGKAREAKLSALQKKRNELYLKLEAALPGHPLLKRIEAACRQELAVGHSLPMLERR